MDEQIEKQNLEPVNQEVSIFKKTVILSVISYGVWLAVGFVILVAVLAIYSTEQTRPNSLAGPKGAILYIVSLLAPYAVGIAVNSLLAKKLSKIEHASKYALITMTLYLFVFLAVMFGFVYRLPSVLLILLNPFIFIFLAYFIQLKLADK